jgi:hypothetical protein
MSDQGKSRQPIYRSAAQGGLSGKGTMASYEYYDPKPKQKRVGIPQNKTNTQYGKDKQIQGYLREANKKKGQV